ncbi:MAG: DUF983 domain-containing protein [Pseudomonadota bacterium]
MTETSTIAASGDAGLQEFGGEATGQRPWLTAMGRGARKKCPRCGRGRLLRGYSRTVDACDHCRLDIDGRHQADDAPPYFTIFIVGHIVVPLALAVKQLFDPPMWLQFAIWSPTILLATLWMLPICKGALVGLQWAHRMHGFAGPDDTPSPAV